MNRGILLLLLNQAEGRQNMKHVIENNYDALVQALTLALTAPTPETQQRCVDVAEAFAATLSDAEKEHFTQLLAREWLSLNTVIEAAKRSIEDDMWAIISKRSKHGTHS